MNIIKNTWDIVEKFVEDPKYVTILINDIDEVAKTIKKNLPDKPFYWGPPKIQLTEYGLGKIYRIIFYDLVASSINYQYWYGKHNIRPNNSGAIKMYELLTDAFNENDEVGTVINSFATKLIMNRFPNVEQRIVHLQEIVRESTGAFVCNMSSEILNEGNMNIDYWLSELITTCPGFSGDIFLKRAFLFFYAA